jgi:Beta-propeller domains of methanol dehydrogenase type
MLIYGIVFVARQFGYGGHPRIDDQAGFLDRRELHDFDGFLSAVEYESGIDIRLVFLDRVPDGSLEAFTVRRARELGIGRRVGRRGVLMAYDVPGRRVRIEVGPTLQDIFTDRFTGYLLRHHVGTFFAAGDRNVGLLFTLRLLQSRIRRATMGLEYDPRAAEYIEDASRLATGGGAAANVPEAGDGRGFINVSGDSVSFSRFGAAPTVEGTFDRYLAMLAGGRVYTEAGIFTAETRKFLGRFPVTRAFAEDILLAEYGRQYRVLIRGDLALLYFTDDPFISPHLLRRGPDAGWQIDLVAEIRDTDERSGWPLTWSMVYQDDDYTRAFEDEYVVIARMVRIAGGDNRLLPMHVDTTAIPRGR